ncbi:MAG: hypothetical protein JWR15_3246 [Prosthecobacter sp.]|nr:hypothetical protein [Prosthecobacter sp.]
MIPRFFLLAAIACIAACQSKPDTPSAPPRDLKEEARLHKAGLILIPDLQHASDWEKLIHVDMGVPATKIEVVAGAGFTTVIIKDLKNRGGAEGVAQELRAIAEKQPDKFGPTKVEIRLANAPATINPFTLPTEAAPATPTPGSVLPTLSLPPLRTDGR